MTVHVPHLLLAGPWTEDRITLRAQQAHHLHRVRRASPGAPVSYTDGRGMLGRGRLAEGTVVRGEEHAVAPLRRVSVALTPPASRPRARFLIEKLAELGVGEVVWVKTVNGEGRPPSAVKAASWAVGALEQSRGAWLMHIRSGALSDCPNLVVAERGGAGRDPGGPVTLLVGPEGGLAGGEAPEGAPRLGLGQTVLRVETAAVVGAALLLLGDAAIPGKP